MFFVLVVFLLVVVRELEILDSLYVLFCHEVRIEQELGLRCQIGYHLLRIEDHLLSTAHNRLILNIFSTDVLLFSSLLHLHHVAELVKCRLSKFRI